MPELPLAENEFLSQLKDIVEKNIGNEQFGVSELADEMNMSRSNLLRKVKKLTNFSVSQLISQIRLSTGMDLLRKTSLNVSEVSHQVGFSSTSYFIKCFREYYGYPPGEVGKRELEALNSEKNPEIYSLPVDQESLLVKPKDETRKRRVLFLGAVGLVVALAGGLIIYYIQPSRVPLPARSIAVLPFKNDSNDSSNVYLINGLMESTLNNLQKIKDLKVISRTTAEIYRNTAKSIPEMADELNVNYFVEGSGQKMGDKILLNIQLIDGRSDKHLWSKQYRRESSDIFELQQEIAKNIADEIQAIITPEEKERIEKIPTDDLIAYDLFLKGKDLMHEGSRKSLEEAISYLKKAIERDNKFALAYAAAAIAYYYLDIFQTEQKYLFEISSYADKAMLHDPKLAESLVAKALVYMHRKEYAQAVTFLEKALLFNPNSIIAINFLANVYNYYIPNTAKYLEYALKGIKLDITSQDSVSTSINYLRLSDALVQAGFVEESLTYINKSLAYNPNNFYSRWVKIFILFAKDKNLERTKQLLIAEMNRDTTQLVMVEEVAKVCYLMKDYTCAYQYYERFIKLREDQQLNIFKHEDLKIAIVLSEIGMKEEAEEYVKSFKHLADNEQTIYKHLLLAGYYSYRDDSRKAIEHMKLFAKEDNFKYWMLLFDDDPAVERIKDLPEFKKAMREIENKFWESHKKIRVTLEEKDLL